LASVSRRVALSYTTLFRSQGVSVISRNFSPGLPRLRGSELRSRLNRAAGQTFLLLAMGLACRRSVCHSLLTELIGGKGCSWRCSDNDLDVRGVRAATFDADFEADLLPVDYAGIFW